MTRVSERTFHKSRQHSMIVTLIYIGKRDRIGVLREDIEHMDQV